MRLIFAGTPEPAVPTLRALLDSADHEVVAVLTRPDAPAGRGRTMVASPIADVAAEYGIATLKPLSLKDSDFVDQLRYFSPECIPIVAYGLLVPEPLLSLPSYGWINLHFSLLPAWRGAAPVQAALASGDEYTGATTFILEQGVDTGPVLGVITEKIQPTDTTTQLLSRLAVHGADLMLATLAGLTREHNSVIPQPQSSDGVTFAPKISSEQARIDWSLPAVVIERHVRSMTDFPGAWTMLGEQRIKVSPVTVISDAEHSGQVLSARGCSDNKPGTVVLTKRVVYVMTRSSLVQLNSIQPQGKKMMPAIEWFNGQRMPTEISQWVFE